MGFEQSSFSQKVEKSPEELAEELAEEKERVRVRNEMQGDGSFDNLLSNAKADVIGISRGMEGIAEAAKISEMINKLAEIGKKDQDSQEFVLSSMDLLKIWSERGKELMSLRDDPERAKQVHPGDDLETIQEYGRNIEKHLAKIEFAVEKWNNLKNESERYEMKDILDVVGEVKNLINTTEGEPEKPTDMRISGDMRGFDLASLDWYAIHAVLGDLTQVNIIKRIGVIKERWEAVHKKA